VSFGRNGVHSQDGVALVLVVAALRTRLRTFRHELLAASPIYLRILPEPHQTLPRTVRGILGQCKVTNTIQIVSSSLQTMAQYSVASSSFSNVLIIRQPAPTFCLLVSNPLSQRGEDNVRNCYLSTEALSTLSLRGMSVQKT